HLKIIFFYLVFCRSCCFFFNRLIASAVTAVRQCVPCPVGDLFFRQRSRQVIQDLVGSVQFTLGLFNVLVHKFVGSCFRCHFHLGFQIFDQHFLLVFHGVAGF